LCIKNLKKKKNNIYFKSFIKLGALDVILKGASILFLQSQTGFPFGQTV